MWEIPFDPSFEDNDTSSDEDGEDWGLLTQKQLVKRLKSIVKHDGKNKKRIERGDGFYLYAESQNLIIKTPTLSVKKRKSDFSWLTETKMNDTYFVYVNCADRQLQ